MHHVQLICSYSNENIYLYNIYDDPSETTSARDPSSSTFRTSTRPKRRRSTNSNGVRSTGTVRRRVEEEEEGSRSMLQGRVETAGQGEEALADLPERNRLAPTDGELPSRITRSSTETLLSEEGDEHNEHDGGERSGGSDSEARTFDVQVEFQMDKQGELAMTYSTNADGSRRARPADRDREGREEDGRREEVPDIHVDRVADDEDEAEVEEDGWELGDEDEEEDDEMDSSPPIHRTENQAPVVLPRQTYKGHLVRLIFLRLEILGKRLT
jgi:hypothetical protein